MFTYSTIFTGSSILEIFKSKREIAGEKNETLANLHIKLLNSYI